MASLRHLRAVAIRLAAVCISIIATVTAYCRPRQASDGGRIPVDPAGRPGKCNCDRRDMERPNARDYAFRYYRHRTKIGVLVLAIADFRNKSAWLDFTCAKG